MYFLDLEFNRASRFGTNLTFMVFCVKMEGSDRQSMPIDILARMTAAIDRIRRNVDIFGHFGEQTFAFLLPGIESAQACFLADRIISDLPQVAPELAPYRPALHFGIAAVPADCSELEKMIEAAQTALLAAVERGVSKVQYSELS